MKRIKFILIFFIIFLFYVSLVNAETKLICLEKGETIKFSECNPSMNDRICNSDGNCNYCVNEIRSGVYCPAQINQCNQLGTTCQSIKNSSNINQSNNQTPPAGNNSNTEENKSDTKKISIISSARDENSKNSGLIFKNQSLNITFISQNRITIEDKKDNFVFLIFFLFMFLFEFLALGFFLYIIKKKKR